jgi:hypothetical protein
MAKTHDRTVDQSTTHFETQVVPTHWGDKFADEEKANVEQIINWMNKHKKTRGWISAASSVNRTTVTQLLNGQYPGRVQSYLKKILDTIRHINARENVKTTPFVTTTVSRLVITGCNRARKMNQFAVIAANVGTGKTRTLKEYATDNANTFLIEASPMMSPGALLDDLIDALGVRALASFVTREKKFKVVREQLKKMASPLIILDEADTVNPQTLHNIRRLRDLSDCGIVLAGTSKLYNIISPVGGLFDQIRSRACFFPQPIRAATKEDAIAILTASFADLSDCFDHEGTLKKELVSAFWYYSQGSMRVLVEGMIPAMRDYGLPQHKKLTADVVHAVAKDVLSLS